MSAHNDFPVVNPRLFQLAVEQTRDYALFLLDTRGNILTWNAGAARIKGYAPEEIIGRHFSVFYMPDAINAGWPAHELTMATRDGRFEDEGWRLRKDGSRFWANVVITALRDRTGKLLGFSKITRDLTRRKQHEQALTESEERFRLLVEGVVDYAIIMLDSQGVVTSWNSGAERIIGYQPKDILGKHFSRFFTDADIEGSQPWDELARALQSGRHESEGWRCKADGQQFWARAVVTALHDSTGRLRGFAKVIQDLSNRQHMRALEAATKNVQEFIAVLAHELRNPLAPIRTALHVIETTEPGTPAREQMYAIIGRQTLQLSRIVDDLIDISRLTRGEFVIQRAPIDLDEAVKAAAETAKPVIDAGEHELLLETSTQPLIVYGDAHRLMQLTVNLLNNAARYTAPRGRVTVSTRADGDCAVLEVSDTGRGIESEWTDRIFDMFVQGRPALDRVGGGLGLGLALSRKIAEMHGGTLSAASEGVNRGSRFTLRMPLAGTRSESARYVGTSPFSQMRAQTEPRHVLIVDDNVDAAATMQILIESLGHQTAVTHSGVEALALMDTFRPDVVLLDIGLPGMDGYEVAKQLRLTQGGAQPRIVAVTGWGQEADRKRSHDAGFDLHLIKPVSAEDLAKALSVER